ncbi:MAG: hypothetical protein HY362_03305 [Candidatus Aenigmarchaeota archaeon]|nr:hypothetical protein [Candidatus Aenigmarchaeota archaeon]
MTSISALAGSRQVGGMLGNTERFVVTQTDSQETFVDNHGPYQKDGNALKTRYLGRCLVMGTGQGYLIEHATDNSHILEQDTPKEVAEKLFETTNGREYGTKGLSFIVAGNDGKTSEIYHVHASPKKSRRVSGPVGWIFDGSGARLMRPAFERDIKNGALNLNMGTLQMSMADLISYQWNLGDNAANDIGVNDRWEVGLVTPDKIRTLISPTVPLWSTALEEYIQLNLGVNVTDSEKMGPFWGVMNDLHHAIEIGCRRLGQADYRLNQTFGNQKYRPAGNRVDELIKSKLSERDEERRKLGVLVDAWYSGELETVVTALDMFSDERKTMRTKAVEIARQAA